MHSEYQCNYLQLSDLPRIDFLLFSFRSLLVSIAQITISYKQMRKFVIRIIIYYLCMYPE